ncbi:uncharacterized protein [Physcomitrium patens]|uniref:uncharacterized protein isoform X2 n=1 Tax=Physcomitrium patens TaxID=3218 RepID=UPI003CCCECAE
MIHVADGATAMSTRLCISPCRCCPLRDIPALFLVVRSVCRIRQLTISRRNQLQVTTKFPKGFSVLDATRIRTFFSFVFFFLKVIFGSNQSDDIFNEIGVP